ncbi:MAG: hypothetical protein NVSMB59_00090 [Vulcanimicrobiaceae bacterium]
MQHLTSDQVIDFVHGELTPQNDALVHAHLSSCATCRTETDAELALRDMLRRAAFADEREMPSSIKAAVWEEIRAAKPGPFAALGALLRPAFALPIAAVLLVGGYFVSPLGHPDVRHTVAATYYLQAHAAQSSRGPLAERSTSTGIDAASNQTSIANAYDGGYPATAALGAGR